MHLCRYTAMILAACIFTALLSQSGANQQLKSFKTFNFNWPPNVVHLQGTKTLKMFAPARYNFRCNFSMSIVNLMNGENFSISNETLSVCIILATNFTT